jgi:hypothetical protein
MEATSVDFQWTTRRYIPEDRSLHNHHCDNLRSYKSLSAYTPKVYLHHYAQPPEEIKGKRWGYKTNLKRHKPKWTVTADKDSKEMVLASFLERKEK